MNVFNYLKHCLLLKFKLTKPRIYLCGHTKETEFRLEVKQKYSNKVTIVDPLEYQKLLGIVSHLDNKIWSTSEKERIVKNDMFLMNYSDILVAYVNKITAGTMMEIFYTKHNLEKPVYLIDPSQSLWNDVWLSQHYTYLFENIENCFDQIIKEYHL